VLVGKATEEEDVSSTIPNSREEMIVHSHPLNVTEEGRSGVLRRKDDEGGVYVLLKVASAVDVGVGVGEERAGGGGMKSCVSWEGHVGVGKRYFDVEVFG